MNTATHQKSNTSETILNVHGMTCMSCIRHVHDALIDLGGVAKAEVKLRDGTVVVQHDAAQAPVSALIETLRAAGYESEAKDERAL
jgi:copper chaperone